MFGGNTFLIPAHEEHPEMAPPQHASIVTQPRLSVQKLFLGLSETTTLDQP